MPTPHDGAAQTFAFPPPSRAQWMYPLRTLRRGARDRGTCRRPRSRRGRGRRPHHHLAHALVHLAVVARGVHVLAHHVGLPGEIVVGRVDGRRRRGGPGHWKPRGAYRQGQASQSCRGCRTRCSRAPRLFLGTAMPPHRPGRGASTAAPQSLHVMSCIATFLREAATSSMSATCLANACRSDRLVPWQAPHSTGGGGARRGGLCPACASRRCAPCARPAAATLPAAHSSPRSPFSGGTRPSTCRFAAGSGGGCGTCRSRRASCCRRPGRPCRP